MCVCVCVYESLRIIMMWHKVNFQAEFNRLEFIVFLLLDQLLYQGKRVQSTQLFYPQLGEE